jgi:uncharacterized membrane protein
MVLLLSGMLAGVLFSVARAVGPMFGGLPADRYVQVHQLLDPRFDPLMPMLCALDMITALAVVVFGPGGPARIAWATGLVLTVAVAVISQSCNVPINRQVASWDPASPPADWSRLRAGWASGNQLRTACAVGAFALYIGAVLLSR